MKAKTKISLTVILTIIIAIVSLNITFGLFFQNFILQSEKNQISSSVNSISSYLDERLVKLTGNVNDWAHWDDTFYFISGQNNEFIDMNLYESSYENLDLSFMLYMDEENSIIYNEFYNLEEQSFTEFPSEFSKDQMNLIDFSSIADDVSGILKLGDDFYFVASSNVTDSLEKKDPNGTLIFGRQIDEEIINEMQKISDFEITDMSVLTDSEELSNLRESDNLSISYNENIDNSINVNLLFPNPYNKMSSLLISMELPRDLYLEGMGKVIGFSIFNTLSGLIASLIIFLLVGKYLSKPFDNLIRNVRSIDITHDKFIPLPEKGNDEFTFLSKSINALMNRIKSSQNELVKNKEELHTTLVSIGEGIITVDIMYRIQFVNPVAEKLTGCTLEETKNKHLNTIFNIVNEDTRKPIKNPVEEVFETEEKVELDNHMLLISSNGKEIPAEITAAPIKDIELKVTGCVLVVRDITEKKNKQKHIEYLSYRDYLTGLYNRRFYEEKLIEYELTEDFPISLIVIDVNGLKLTNDAFGHEAGDRLLIKVSDCIKKSCIKENIMARIGGDEFVILMSNASPDDAAHTISLIETEVAKENIDNVPISISSGWASVQRKGESMESLFKHAEDMMYRNKSAERNSLRHQSIQIIRQTLFEKSPREELHSKRVSEFCMLIGAKMQMNASQIKNLQIAGLLHDIGKIGISNDILDKKGPLNEEEWKEIKKHPEISYNILSAVNDYGPLAEIILSHHERWDGAGYPNGLRGAEIPLKSRIIALADAYDAMISDRPYRKGMQEEEALEIIASEAGKQFDPDIVNIFLEKVIKKISV